MESLRHSQHDSASIKCSGRDDDNVESDAASRDPIYLDYNATTPIDPAVAEEMIPVLRAEFGNPSSAHAPGRRANAVVEGARARVAQLLNCSADECTFAAQRSVHTPTPAAQHHPITFKRVTSVRGADAVVCARAVQVVFTSGGTESNNWAIKGAVSAYTTTRSAPAAAAPAAVVAPHVVISAVEHPAVTEVAEHVRAVAGCEVTVVPVDAHGIVCVHQVMAALRPTTAIISITTALSCLLLAVLANNEVGSLQPIARIAAALTSHKAAAAAQALQDAAEAGSDGAAAAAAVFPYLHTDASQAVGKIPMDFAALRADLLTVAAHKCSPLRSTPALHLQLYGPKGVGALVVRRGVHLPKLMHGAGHEKGRRAGTESTVLLAGLGKACELARACLLADAAHSERMRSRLLHGLARHLCLVTPQAVTGEGDGKTVPGKESSNGAAAAATAAATEGDGEGDKDMVRFRVNGPCDPSQRLPNTLSLSFEGLHGPTLMARLLPRVACSAGAACHSSPAPPCPAPAASSPSFKPEASAACVKGSSVLEAMGVDGRYAGCTVRVSPAAAPSGPFTSPFRPLCGPVTTCGPAATCGPAVTRDAAAGQHSSRAAQQLNRPAAEPPYRRAAQQLSRPAAEPPCSRAALPPSRPAAEPPCRRAAEPPYCLAAAISTGAPRPLLPRTGELTSSQATAVMATPSVLTFDAEGRAVDFEVWVDDLQLFLQCDMADGLSLFDLTSGASPTHAADADASVRSQWATRDAAARLALRCHLPTTERAHFSQYKSAQTLYDAVVARYSSPATAALCRIMLPYLFPDLAAFPTVANLITHLRTSDTRYRAALLAEDHFLSVFPTTFTVDLLEKALLSIENSIVVVGASRGDPRTPVFEGCSPSPFLPSIASAAAAALVGFESVGAASAPSGRRRTGKGKGGKGTGGAGGGGGGGGGGCGGSAMVVEVVPGVAAVAAVVEAAEAVEVAEGAETADAWRRQFPEASDIPC
ncbi:unnamed protein product [Closterium sp. NIES-65]|nr:unnamed protein product [Closterium sp. NIES-65]